MTLVAVVAFLAVLGLVVGSLLSAVAAQMSGGSDVEQSVDVCATCGRRREPVDRVLSTLVLASSDTCRSCRRPIAMEPTVLALLNAAVWILLASRFADDDATEHPIGALPAFLVFGSVLVVQSWIDVRERRLPREITFTGMVLGGVALVVAAFVVGEPERIWMALLGAAIALAAIGGIYLVSNLRYGQDVAFGFGDVILAPLLGMFLGWLNPGIVLPALFLGFILGALAAIPAMVIGTATGETQIPFGPFLALGSVGAVLMGQSFIDLVVGY